MSISSVKKATSSIADIIVSARDNFNAAKSKMELSAESLRAITSEFADEIEEINGFSSHSSFESLAQDELTKLTSEYTALLADIETILANVSKVEDK